MPQNDGEQTNKEALGVAVAALKAEFSVDEDCGEYNATAIWGTPEEVVRKVIEVASPILLENVWQSAFEQGVADERVSQRDIPSFKCICTEPRCICKPLPAHRNPYSRS